MFKDYIILQAVEYIKDDLEQEIENKIGDPRIIFCDRQSISQSEFFECGRMGIKPSHKFVLNTLDYQDERTLLYNNKEFFIYRTFIKEDFIELYCEVRQGG